MSKDATVTTFCNKTTLKERRQLNRSGIFMHNISEVINLLKGSSVKLNYSEETMRILKDKFEL